MAASRQIALEPKRTRQKSLPSQDESKRVVVLSMIVDQVQSMVESSGRSEGFDAAQWVASWIETSVPALGGKRPAELLDALESLSCRSLRRNAILGDIKNLL